MKDSSWLWSRYLTARRRKSIPGEAETRAGAASGGACRTDPKKRVNIPKHFGNDRRRLLPSDLSGKLTLINDSLCDMIGYSREELLGMGYPKLMDEVSAGNIASMPRSLQDGQGKASLDLEV